MKKHCLWALIFSWALACGAADREGATTTTPPMSTEPVSPPIAPETAGNIIGKVILEGSVPEPKGISMAADSFCAKMHMGDVETEAVVTNEDGSLRNVFVYVKKGLEGRLFQPPSVPAVLTQRGCVYTPHVFGIMTGQPLEIVNDDDTLHNVRAVPDKNPPFNLGQPERGHKVTKTFTIPEVMIPIKCDVHKWMSSYVGVVEHPYFYVTGDGGKFELLNLPPGDFVIEAWHETFGTQTLDITLAERQTREITLTYEASE